ncbi:PrsW family intramembrane metalloprotease [Streptomyces sp. NPDC052042]|uniref:PrsW family intramembrane metalloprotease n=1 Tax=Streptomyces sp. NPDC052042 TaxID=3365683 RepID=UPI0037D50A05
MMWRSRTFRIVAVCTVLALCGLAILALVRDQTGTEGFLVGLGLAVLPVPLLMAAFRWLDRVDPAPWRNLLFALAWGAFAAALIAILANSFATRWIATATADPLNADNLGATVIAPVVEESAKAAAILLVFLFRRREFSGIVDGAAVAGFTASGFAFTENILYLGTAFGEDQQIGTSGVVSVTAATFFVRAVLSPFAHPLFTVLTGVGFGLAAASARNQWFRRLAFPLLGLVLAMGMHALWNGSASFFGPLAFYAVYAVIMVPLFGVVTWLVIWARRRELRALAAELPAYAAAGWLAPADPLALSSMRARGLARDAARRSHFPGTGTGWGNPYGPAPVLYPAPAHPTVNGHGPAAVNGQGPVPAYGHAPAAPAGAPAPAPAPAPARSTAQSRAQAKAQREARAQAKARGKAAARTVAEYESFAMSLASLRRQGRRGTAGPDFAVRELELLHHLWERRDVAAPALAYAAQRAGLLRPRPFPPAPPAYWLPPGPGAFPPPHQAYGGHNPYR